MTWIYCSPVYGRRRVCDPGCDLRRLCECHPPKATRDYPAPNGDTDGYCLAYADAYSHAHAIGVTYAYGYAGELVNAHTYAYRRWWRRRRNPDSEPDCQPRRR